MNSKEAHKPIEEFHQVETIPPLESGGFLEMKHGKKCLRLADEIEQIGPQLFRILKSWQPPIGQPFDEDLYESR